MGHRRVTVTARAQEHGARVAEHARGPSQLPAHGGPMQLLGNQAWHSLLSARVLQAKLTISDPADVYEQEADRVADQVMRMPDAAPHVQGAATVQVQRVCSSCEQALQRAPPGQDEEPVQRKPSGTVLQRSDDEEEDEADAADAADNEDERELQRSVNSAPSLPQLDAGFESAVAGLKGRGSALPDSLRAFMEPRFNADFSAVRVHTDAQAHSLARAADARAFTVGHDVVFGAGYYVPQSDAGRRLLAHELTHVLQQKGTARPTPRQQAAAPARLQREQAQPAPQQQRSGTVTIRWHGSIRASLFIYLRGITTEEQAGRIANQVLSDPSVEYITPAGRSVSRAEFDRAQRDLVLLTQETVAFIARETGRSVPSLQAAGMFSELYETLAELRGERSLLQGGRSAEALENETARNVGPTEPVNADWESLLDQPALGLLYVRLMEHFAGMPLTDEIRAMARDGLSIEELSRITANNRLYVQFTGLIAQGWREFRDAGGSDLDHYERLERSVLEQGVWGNPTARRNQLRIGHGWPERDILGIADRSSGVLLYDADGQPLRSFAGQMMRDPGWVGAQPPDEFGINIAAIDDPVLRGLLNMLRHQTTEPTRIVVRAAQIYLDNIEAVNSRVQRGLTDEIITKFEQTLPMFVGFLAGHGLSTLMIRSPNPTVVAIGAAVKTGLVALGYVLQIDFLGSALERLFQAANHLVHVRRVENERLSELSENHLELAAVPLRQMVTEVAMSVAFGVLGRLVRGLSCIRCTRCRISSREARVRRRAGERRGEGQRVGRLTRAEVDALRRAIIRRPQVTQVTQRHVGAERHFQNDADPILLRTINDPQRVFVSANGSWVFYRNGTIAITQAHNPSMVLTAYGNGGTIPSRHIADFRAGAFGNPPNPQLRTGAPEPPISLQQWLAAPQQSGVFEPFPIWP